MEQSFDISINIDNFVVKDKKYRKSRRNKRIKLILIIFGILVIIAVIIFVIYKIFTINYGKITCIYRTKIDNENIELINSYEGYLPTFNFYLIIEEEKFDQEYNHTFKNAGNHTVTFVFKDKLTTLEYLFREKPALIEADLSQLEADEVTSLKMVFYECENLKKVKFNFAEANKINDMSRLFWNCTSLESISFNINTENVIDMSGMFGYCHSLKSIDFSNFNTKNLQYMDFMFNKCYNLPNIDLSNFNFDQIVDMTYTFQACEQVTKIKFPKSTYTHKLVYMTGTFRDLKEMESLDLNFLRTENVEQMKHLFRGCYKLKKVDLSKFDTSKVWELDGMFLLCYALKEITYLSHLNFATVTSFDTFFKGCRSLEELDLSFINAPIAIDMTEMFMDCSKLKRIIIPPKLYGISKLNSTFENCYELEYVDLSGFKENEDIVYASKTFKNCKSLNNITFPKIEADNLKTTEEMFYGCIKLEHIDMGDFQTIYIKKMDKMFYDCSSLVFLNISNFNTHYLKTANDTFSGVTSPIRVIINDSVGNGVLKEQFKNLNLINMSEFSY